MGEQLLVQLLRALPSIPKTSLSDVSALVESAERHGLAGVVHQHLIERSVSISGELDITLKRRSLARDLDHTAHLELLSRIDDAFAEVDVDAAVLKGPLFAERFYERPSTRATTDIDLLIREDDIERAAIALRNIGYTGHEGLAEARFRREHHHLHFVNPVALPLELHFHAYRGFGRRLSAKPFIRRRSIVKERGYRKLGVLSAEDELVYLAVHAAAHRFERLGWLWDMKLLLARMTYTQKKLAADRARDWGFARVLAFSADMLHEVLGVGYGELAPLGRLDELSRIIAHRMVRPSGARAARAATRFVYATALCASPVAAARHTVETVQSSVSRAILDLRTR